MYPSHLRPPRSTDAALCRRCQNGDSADAVILPLHGTGRRNGPYRLVMLSATTSRLRLSLFPDGSSTSISVSNLVNRRFRVPDVYCISSSAQCNEAANKAMPLIFMKRLSSQDLSKSVFNHLYRDLVRPHLEFGMRAC